MFHFIVDLNLLHLFGRKCKHGAVYYALIIMILCLQVYIRIQDNEWNVYRRYTEFRELHNYLRTQFPQVDAFNFPPKKALGNKVSKGDLFV